MESSWRSGKTAESTRFPLRPVIGSLALHALVLGWFVPVPLDVVRELPPAGFLQGRLLPAASSKEIAQTEMAASPAQTRQFAAKASAEAKASAAVPPAPIFQAAEAGESHAGKREDRPAASGQPIPRDLVGPATVAIASQPSAISGPDANGLRQYRMALASEARRWRRYPEAARRGELTGTAEVRVAIEAGGAARRTELSRSSGHAALDDAALEMLQLAAVRAELPSSLRGHTFAVLLPVVFAVED